MNEAYTPTEGEQPIKPIVVGEDSFKLEDSGESSFDKVDFDINPEPIKMDPIVTEPIKDKIEIDPKTGSGKLVKGKKSNEAELMLDYKPDSNTKAINDDGTLTDFGRDQALVQALGVATQEGRKLSEAIDADVPEDSQMKARTLMYGKMVRNGIEPSIAADEVGLSSKIIDMTGKLSRFTEGLKLNTKELTSGALAIMNEVNQAAGEGEQADFWNAPANAAHEEANNQKQKVDVLTDVFKNMYTTYDTATGKADQPWDVSGTAGESALSMAGGVATGTLVKGTTAYQTAIRQSWVGTGLAFAEASVRAGHHKDVGTFALEMGGAVAGEMLGLYASKMFIKADYSLAENKGLQEIDEALKGLEILQKYDVKLGDMDITNAEDMSEALIGKLQNKGLTLAESNEVLQIYKGRNSELMLGIDKSLNKLGFGSVKEYFDYASGKTPYEDLPIALKEMHTSKRIETQASLGPKYDALEKMDVDPVSGKKQLYNVESTKSPDGKTQLNLVQDFEDLILMNKEAGNFVLSTFNALRRHKDLDTKQATLGFENSSRNVKAKADKLTKTNADINLVEASLAQREQDLAVMMLANSRAKSAAVNVRNAPKIIKAESDIKSLKLDLAKGKRERGGDIARYEKANSEYLSLRRANQDTQTMAKVDIGVLTSMRKMLNNKKYVAGGSISRNNDMQEATIDKAIKTLDDYIEIMMDSPGSAQHSKQFYTKYKLVNQEAREGFTAWGTNTRTKQINKLMMEGTTEDRLNFFKNNGSIENLNALRTVVGEDSDVYKDTVNHVIKERMFDQVVGSSQTKGTSNWDYDRLAKNVKDPEFVRMVVGTRGKEAYDEIAGVAWLGKTMGKEFDKITKKFGGVLNIPSVTKDHKFKNSKLGDSWNRLTWMMERYTGGLIQGKFYTGDSTKGPVGSFLKNTIANAIEVASGQAKLRTGLLPDIGVRSIPNQSMTTRQMIKSLEKQLNAIPDREKQPFLKKFIASMTEGMQKTKIIKDK